MIAFPALKVLVQLKLKLLKMLLNWKAWHFFSAKAEEGRMSVELPLSVHYLNLKYG